MSARCTDRPGSRRQSSPPATVAPNPHHLPSSPGFRPSINRRSLQTHNSQRLAPWSCSSPSPTPTFRNTFVSPQAGPLSNSSPQESALAKAGPYAHDHTSTSQNSRSKLNSLPEPPSVFAPPGGFNPHDLDLLRAGYKYAYVLAPPPFTSTGASTAEPAAGSAAAVLKAPKRKSVRFDMAEPRARAARHKGQMNFGPEMRHLLLAYGDPAPHHSFSSEPLPETIRVLDEIVTDFILELCHGAAQVAHHARRQKIKVDDFRFSLRRDPNKLGRVQELLRMERELKEARKAFDQNDDQVAKDAGKKGAPVPEDDDNASVAGTVTGKKGKGKGKRGAANRRGSDATEESVPKKRKTLG
ncbi:Transcription initiation factor TFIID subunit 13 [Penicillium maclennaniae]|uniref:Transcription initiation factor TFIID subunit 13 n=1 Tax=Penicillium maclennaniae TaxID=1343394 RepID=UPI00253FBED7|nr:Transcription initiation factor TFIID subunit 13 [Penicillium maclennaniae]KAJ5684750.1 Transcription initiation factor TFIID subunit 13 [Penicillium maclennaniae]